MVNIHDGEQVIYTSDLRELQEERDGLLEAAKAVIEAWDFDEIGLGAMGTNDSGLKMKALRQAILLCRDE